MSKHIYISLGSNLEPRKHLPEAMAGLKKLVTVHNISPTYRSMPYGITAQPHFLNVVTECFADCTPLQLLKQLLSLEKTLGRVRANIPKNGPRLIDLDILDFQSLTMSHPQLTLPHPQLHKRNFILKPLSDVSPSWRHPILKCSAAKLLQDNQTNPPVREFLKLNA